jgi:hypothetical protein
VNGIISTAVVEKYSRFLLLFVSFIIVVGGKSE